MHEKEAIVGPARKEHEENSSKMTTGTLKKTSQPSISNDDRESHKAKRRESGSQKEDEGKV